MTWLTPQLAAIAAAIAVPALVILYFLKLRRRDVEISTTLLWKKTIQDIQANAPFQRLRKNILLLLQLIVLAGVLLALGQPELHGEGSEGERRVIMIDRSASMSAADGQAGKPGERTRLAKAKEAALKLVESLREPSIIGTGPVDEAMVIAFDTTAEVRQQFTSDKAMLRAAINGIEPSDAPSSLAEAMSLARAHLPDKTQVDSVTNPTTGETTTSVITLEGVKAGGAKVHLFSDGRLPDAEEAVTGAEDVVTFVQVGQTDAPNIAISAMRAERAFDNPTQVSLYVGIQNTGREAREVELELLINGIVSRVKTIAVPAAEASIAGAAPGADAEPADQPEDQDAAALAGMLPWTPGIVGVTFEFEQPEGGVFAAQLTGVAPEHDLLAVDNRSWMIVPPARQLSVALVTQGNIFLVTALEGLPLAKLVQYSPEQYDAAAAKGETAEFDVVVFDGWLPTIDGAPGLPPGRFLVLGGIPAPLGIAADSEPAQAQVLDWRRDHPVMRLLLLDNLYISRLPDVVVPEDSGGVVLAESDRGPALIELTRAQTRALVVPFNAADSTWPFDVSFVVFVGAGINYLGQEGGLFGETGGGLRPGAVLTDRLPIGAGGVRIDPPGAEPEAQVVPAADGRIAYGPIRTAGLYTVSWNGPAGAGDATDGSRVVRTYAANLLDPAESDIAASPMLLLAGEEIAAQDADEAKAMIRLWPWLILAALAVLMLEWFVYNRKVHV
ncbi:MAG TPA: VWA domain-containing protein [Phycisphaerales bacterium]|nr:VWA domain-containing protein [Phycisphaerales bacterium]